MKRRRAALRRQRAGAGARAATVEPVTNRQWPRPRRLPAARCGRGYGPGRGGLGSGSEGPGGVTAAIPSEQFTLKMVLGAVLCDSFRLTGVRFFN